VVAPEEKTLPSGRGWPSGKPTRGGGRSGASKKSHPVPLDSGKVMLARDQGGKKGRRSRSPGSEKDVTASSRVITMASAGRGESGKKGGRFTHEGLLEGKGVCASALTGGTT